MALCSKKMDVTKMSLSVAQLYEIAELCSHDMSQKTRNSIFGHDFGK